jgi:predicted nucleic acid-binding protein
LLVEVGTACAAKRRDVGYSAGRGWYVAPRARVLTVDTTLLLRALSLYEQRHDKQWGLTDCISFVVMQDHHLTDALTADHHFEQAGFLALLAEPA